MFLQIDGTPCCGAGQPHRGDDFGTVGDAREQVTLWRAEFQHRMLALGAPTIDASNPLHRVADALLHIEVGPEGEAWYSPDEVIVRGLVDVEAVGAPLSPAMR